MWPAWFNRGDKTKLGRSLVDTPQDGLTSAQFANQLRGEAKRVWILRKREFDKLRQLRQNDTQSDNKPKQKFFHTSVLTDLREKSTTIQKIDEIEAQMSMQWWKTEVMEYIPSRHT